MGAIRIIGPTIITPSIPIGRIMAITTMPPLSPLLSERAASTSVAAVHRRADRAATLVSPVPERNINISRCGGKGGAWKPKESAMSSLRRVVATGIAAMMLAGAAAAASPALAYGGRHHWRGGYASAPPAASSWGCYAYPYASVPYAYPPYGSYYLASYGYGGRCSCW